MKWWLCLVLPAAVAGLYVLCRKGFWVSKSIRAVLFVFRPGKDGDRASLNACTGWLRRPCRFRQAGTYEFTLDCRLSAGEASVCLLDGEKRQVLELSRDFPAGKAALSEKGRYILRWEWKSATGKCELGWRRTEEPS